MTLLEAFQLLIANAINGIPVINWEGKLVANLSAVDFEVTIVFLGVTYT
jgi:CBS domain-containing protein